MLTREEDIKALRLLNDLSGSSINFRKIRTDEFMEFLVSLNIENPPLTCFVKIDGHLDRDPGKLKSWKEAFCVVTTEG